MKIIVLERSEQKVQTWILSLYFVYALTMRHKKFWGQFFLRFAVYQFSLEQELQEQVITHDLKYNNILLLILS